MRMPEWWNLPAGRQAGWYINQSKMYFVYAIRSVEKNYIDVGMTNDLERRIKQHNSRRSFATRPYAPFVLIYKEAHPNRVSAREREKFLKSGSGKEFLKSLF